MKFSCYSLFLITKLGVNLIVFRKSTQVSPEENRKVNCTAIFVNTGVTPFDY